MSSPDKIEVKFKYTDFKISNLIDLDLSGRLDLSPHYQRNDIWTLKSQRQLIETIISGYPLPNFFFRIKTSGIYEVVDGQQRCRTILAFWSGAFCTSQKLCFNEETKKLDTHKALIASFKNYPLSICTIDSSVPDDAVERFYVLVNKSGLRLNTPELRKAEFYSTRFLKLASELAGYPKFENLALFTDRSTERMNDIDYVSELLTYLLYGFTDKKEKVDSTYEEDITADQKATLKSAFTTIIDKISQLEQIVPLNKTRFRQKGDFYSLFAFIEKHPSLSIETLKHLYHILLRLSPGIRPSQEYCEPLKNYALNCVTQSNSKKARETRDELLEDILLNTEPSPNQIQLQVAAYFELKPKDFEHRWGLTLLPLDKLKDPNQPELTL